MTNEQYLLEMHAKPTERGLLAALWKNANDVAARNALVDYLLEEGRRCAAEAVRAGWTPGGVPVQSSYSDEYAKLRDDILQGMGIPLDSFRPDPSLYTYIYNPPTRIVTDTHT